MREVFADEGGTRTRLLLSETLNEGAAGTIHRVTGRPGMVAKIYKPEVDRNFYRRKVEAMLARPPRLDDMLDQGKRRVQLAWPRASLFTVRGDFAGFLMPEVDFDSSSTLDNILQKATRRADKIPEFYGFRVLLAANLAAVMTELHVLGHYMIDMKPQNMRFYPGTWSLAILDTDGFSLQGQSERYPSHQYSDGYISPSARGRRPEDLGVEQDLFALAVIIFQLLNNGLHPYQGVAKTARSLPTGVQDRIFEGLYAYGAAPHFEVGPARADLSPFFETATRSLFDRAFSGGRRAPSALEWRDHLKGFVAPGGMNRCRSKPQEHAHFSPGCGLCEQERTLRKPAAGSPPPTPAGPANAAPPYAATAAFAAATQVATPAPWQAARPPADRTWMIYAGVAVAALIGWILWSSGRAPQPDPASAADAQSISAANAAADAAVAAAAAPSAAVPVTYATSFDCARASGWAEGEICADMRLARADRELAELYGRRVAELDAVGGGRLRNEQRAWIRSRNSCSSDECLNSAYADRAAALNAAASYAAGPVQTGPQPAPAPSLGARYNSPERPAQDPAEQACVYFNGKLICP